jgi:hypothetical protein
MNYRQDSTEIEQLGLDEFSSVIGGVSDSLLCSQPDWWTFELTSSESVDTFPNAQIQIYTGLATLQNSATAFAVSVRIGSGRLSE